MVVSCGTGMCTLTLSVGRICMRCALNCGPAASPGKPPGYVLAGTGKSGTSHHDAGSVVEKGGMFFPCERSVVMLPCTNLSDHVHTGRPSLSWSNAASQPMGVRHRSPMLGRLSTSDAAVSRHHSRQLPALLAAPELVHGSHSTDGQ